MPVSDLYQCVLKVLFACSFCRKTYAAFLKRVFAKLVMYSQGSLLCTILSLVSAGVDEVYEWVHIPCALVTSKEFDDLARS